MLNAPRNIDSPIQNWFKASYKAWYWPNMEENMMKTPSIIFGTCSQHVCLLVYLRFFFQTNQPCPQQETLKPYPLHCLTGRWFKVSCGWPGFSTYGCGSKRVDPPKWICQLLNMIRVFWYPFASLVLAAIFGKPGLTCMALPWISSWKDFFHRKIVSTKSTWVFFLVSSSRLPDLRKRNWLYCYFSCSQIDLLGFNACKTGMQSVIVVNHIIEILLCASKVNERNVFWSAPHSDGRLSPQNVPR